uniref:hypothetical protein n=1 Tax=Acetatifactor sp. TaxID=1872090 RepID=UPI00405710DC
MSYTNVKDFIEKCKEPENYNFEFECDIEEYIGFPSFDRYFTYKANNRERRKSIYDAGRKFAISIQDNEKYKQLVDCDGAVLAREIYSTLWGWCGIPSNKERYGMVSVDEFGLMGPDTMNSAQFLMNDVIESFLLKDENKDMLELKKGNCSINYMLELYSNNSCKEKFLNNLGEIRWLKEYINLYHTIGNFVLVPAYLNPFRARKVEDYWERSLALLQNKNEQWMCKQRNGEHHEIFWDKSNYNLYINFFFLWDYVDENGNPLFLSDWTTSDQLNYMERIIRMIKRRSLFMVMLLKLQAKIGINRYNEMKQAIFENDEIYSGYDEVISLLIEHIKEIGEDTGVLYDTKMSIKRLEGSE